MAPLPPQSTGRVWLDYETGGGATSQEHTVMWRYSVPLGGTPEGCLGAMALFFLALDPSILFTGWQPLRARYAAPASVISLPLALNATLAAYIGTGQETALRTDQAREVSWEGRDFNVGRRVSFSLYGFEESALSGSDFRVAPVGGNFVQETLEVFDEIDGAYLVTIGGSRAVFQQYVNWQYNSYWERRLRA